MSFDKKRTTEKIGIELDVQYNNNSNKAKVKQSSINPNDDELEDFEKKEIDSDEEITNEENSDNEEVIDEENSDNEESDNEESDNEESDNENKNDKNINNENKENKDKFNNDNKTNNETRYSPNRSKFNNKKEDFNSDGGQTNNKFNFNESEKETDNKNKPMQFINKAKSKAANLLKASSHLFSLLVSFVLNPIFWILIITLAFLIAVYSATTTLGKNDFNELCDFNGAGGIMLPDNADEFTRQSGIVSWLTATPFEAFGNKPMTREQAIGVMGNLIQESYGANPLTMQGDNTMEDWKTCDNDCVISKYQSQGGKGLGIIQWDSGRRVNLVNFAKERGTQWYDLETQLFYLKKELDSGEGRNLVKGGFLNPANSVEDYAYIWNKYFERSADSKNRNSTHNQKREAYAREFSSKYTGGGSIAGSGLASHCVGTMGIDSTNLVSLAVSIAYPEKSQAKLNPLCSTLVNCGKNLAPPAYIEAKALAEQKGGKDPINGLFASCDRFVATVVKATGTDVKFPWGSSGTQGNYLRDSSNGWQEISCQDRQPGDVLWREGHVMIYIGDVNGKDSIASASIGDKNGGRVGAISGNSCSGSQFMADGKPNTGYRKVR